MPKRRWSSTWHQIFISSTYKDLIEERQKVTHAILKLYHFPIGMEMFHADNDEKWTQNRFYGESVLSLIIKGKTQRLFFEDNKCTRYMFIDETAKAILKEE